MLSHLLHYVWAANTTPTPAADLAAPSPITIPPPFPGIPNAAGERIIHCPEAAAGAGLDLWLAQVKEEKKKKQERTALVLTCSKQQWWNKGHSAPIERAGLQTGWLISDSTWGPWTV